MKITKIELLTTLKGNNRMIWGKGLVLSAPFHPDVASILNDRRVVRVLAYEKEEKNNEGTKETEKEVNTAEGVTQEVKILKKKAA